MMVMQAKQLSLNIDSNYISMVVGLKWISQIKYFLFLIACATGPAKKGASKHKKLLELK